MRRSYNFSWIKNDQGEVVALNLGSDYCAEHEWGIKAICSTLGISNQGTGITARQITNTPQEYTFILDEVTKKKTGKTILIVDRPWAVDSLTKNIKNMSGSIKPMQPLRSEAFSPLSCAWGEQSFGIVASSPEDRENLRKIIEAFTKKDLAIWLGGGGVFENSGLVLGIISKVPEANKQEMEQADLERIALETADQATGIKTRLAAAGKKFYALSPRWINKEKENTETAYDIIYWLNPMEQQQNNYGWYTVEQLEQWANNQGPIPKV